MPKALVAGATGGIGKHVLSQLVEGDEVEHVYAFTRREGAIPTSEKVTQILLTGDNAVDFSKIPSDVDVVFDCVGTTIKQAGSKEAFRKTDFIFNTELAAKCKELKVSQFHLVSSVSANHESSNFYLHTKGEVEENMKALQLPYLAIYRPGVLNNAERAQFRFGEAAANVVLKGLTWFTRRGSLGEVAPIDVRTVASAMIANYKQKRDDPTNQTSVELLNGSTEIENYIRK